MIIPAGDNWRIRSEPNQWVAEKRHTPKANSKNPEPYWSPQGYYSTIESAAVGVYEIRLRLSDAHGLQEATEAAKTIARELQDALAPHLRLLPRAGGQ